MDVGAETNPFVGKYFHSTESDGHTIRWQGYVKEHVGGPKDLYRVWLYPWFIGQEHCKGPIWPRPEATNFAGGELIPSEDTVGWRFYNSQEEMNRYYRDCVARGKTASSREATSRYLLQCRQQKKLLVRVSTAARALRSWIGWSA